MAEAASNLSSASPFSSLLRIGGAAEAGIVVAERTGCGLASLTLIGDDLAKLSQMVEEAIGLALPSGPKRVARDGLCLLGSGPKSWFVLARDRSLMDRLATAIGTYGALVDQSDAYGVLSVSGAKARALFEKGLSVDLHPDVFGCADVAVTLCAQVGIILWQAEEAEFRLALYRSFAASFWHWLQESAAEYGLRVEGMTGRG